jgi:hypothetical protein
MCSDNAAQRLGTGAGADVDSAWEQRKLEAREMLENAARRETAGHHFIQENVVTF